MARRRLLFVVIPLLFGLGALCLGQDCNWDLRNYHYYNVYAWFHGRMQGDFAPGYLNSYYNPVFWIPHYFAAQYLSPRAWAFILGTIYGLVFIPLERITSLCLNRAAPSALSIALALAGMLGAAPLSELGTSLADNILALPTLVALAALLEATPIAPTSTASRRSLLLSGALIGLVIGLKLSTAYIGPPFLLLVAMLTDRPHRRRAVFVFGGAAFVAMLLAAGPWAAVMVHRFGNPLFPMFNRIFHSPFASPDNPYRYEVFLPKGLWQTLADVVLVPLNEVRISEQPFRDLRLLLFFAALAGACLSAPERSRLWRSKGAFALSVFFVSSYLLWLVVFAHFRFLLPFYVLAPSLGAAVIVAVLPEQRTALLAYALVVALVVVTTKPPDWGRRPFSDDIFDLAPLPLPAHALVVTTGPWPNAYLAREMSDSTAFVRYDDTGDPLSEAHFSVDKFQPNPYARELLLFIRAFTGPRFLLRPLGHSDPAPFLAATHTLARSCHVLKPGIEEFESFQLCRLEPEPVP